MAAANQKMKNTVAKAIHAFNLMEEYNAILFGWYFKGFELSRRYLVKHKKIVRIYQSLNNTFS